ncbi:hypothetical protein ALC57_00415 [Trachymyrmex cornetzi]|uniref:Uncharacterized protein n=1 Tax=Trachymyrmex cornetzi TaxID=471704 RepID=A0A151JS13_9HYME|nr:hypothetical protein ALC57_00415 [Trachymyrmex cornetzi]
MRTDEESRRTSVALFCSVQTLTALGVKISDGDNDIGTGEDGDDDGGDDGKSGSDGVDRDGGSECGRRGVVTNTVRFGMSDNELNILTV